MNFWESKKKLEKENTKLRKDNTELINRLREVGNQMQVLQTNFTAEITQLTTVAEHMQKVVTTSSGQVQKSIKDTLQRISPNEKVIFGPSYIDENYNI